MKIPNYRYNLKMYSSKGEEVFVRSVDELRRFGNLSDILDVFKTGDLVAWLHNQGEESLAAEVAKFQTGCLGSEMMRRLVAVLGLEADEKVLNSLCRALDRAGTVKSQGADDDDSEYFQLLIELEEETDPVRVGALVDRLLLDYPKQVLGRGDFWRNPLAVPIVYANLKFGSNKLLRAYIQCEGIGDLDDLSNVYECHNNMPGVILLRTPHGRVVRVPCHCPRSRCNMACNLYVSEKGDPNIKTKGILLGEVHCLYTYDIVLTDYHLPMVS